MEIELKKEIFNNVYGYEDVKKELNLIKSWYQNKNIINNTKVTLPKGIMFYGVPGCGKTLLLREFSSSFKAPIYIINGKEENLANEITCTFSKAKKEKFALVLIDEIDLLIGGNSNIERVMQEQLDGINTKGKILVLATTNHIRHIDSALLRPGRFDRLIEINYPDKESREKIFINFLKELSVDIKNINFKHLVKVAVRCNGAQIKAICNDVFLRCGDNINTEDLEKSYSRIVCNDYNDNPSEHKNMRVAIHEAGHAVMCMRFNKNWSFYRSKFNKTGGITETQEVDEFDDTFEKREQHLMIGLGGYIAEELYYGKHDIGSYNDYSNVYSIAKGFIERSGKEGFEHYIEPYDSNEERYETLSKREKNEKLVLKLLKKYEKNVKKYLKKHLEEVKIIANKMFENGEIKYNDITNIISIS